MSLLLGEYMNKLLLFLVAWYFILGISPLEMSMMFFIYLLKKYGPKIINILLNYDPNFKFQLKIIFYEIVSLTIGFVFAMLVDWVDNNKVAGLVMGAIAFFISNNILIERVKAKEREKIMSLEKNRDLYNANKKV
ncbi:MAG: hypothetical protein GX336_07745 [Halanaerobiaceae bacterium]|nr:hypothetical protein [Halanaerobiaceae bacterium]